jgi:tetratricopeptide (TPR) repeat protein
MRGFLTILFLLISALSFGQDQQMAYDYFRKGEYEKSASIYKTLYEQNNFNSNYLLRLLYCERQLENYENSKILIDNHIKKYPRQVHFYIELGYNYELQYDHINAEIQYKKALDFLQNNPNYGYAIGRSFQNNHLLDYALDAYKITTIANPNANYNIQIAAIYGEKGEIENMFNSYLDMLGVNEKYTSTILRYLGKYTTEDRTNSYNTLLRKLILKRLQVESKNCWNQLLSWLYTQQKQYGKAFVQEKAIHKRNDTLSLTPISSLGEIAFDNYDFDATSDCFNYILENSENKEEIIDSKLYLLHIAIETNENKEEVDAMFQQLFTEYGKTPHTINIQIVYADFLAFELNVPQKGILILKDALEFRSDDFQKGVIKIKLADLLVFSGKFNEALIYFSQVQSSLKNHILAQEARFKVAQTSYYKGDFKWAQTQLKVLKTSTSQLIANDALELSLIITDNSVNDSLKKALKMYAQADLLAFQNKNIQAIDSLNIILTDHKGHAIEDEALFKQGELFEKLNEFDKATENYLNLIAINPTDILVDNAYYRLAEISLKQNHIEKAKEYYQKIIFDFSSSIYLVDARKKFRQLRGDDLQ